MEIQKFEYLEKEKSFLDGIKNVVFEEKKFKKKKNLTHSVH